MGAKTPAEKVVRDIRPRCAISFGKSIAVAFSNPRAPHECEFATDTILDGTQPTELELERLLKGIPVSWNEQRRDLGISRG